MSQNKRASNIFELDEYGERKIVLTNVTMIEERGYALRIHLCGGETVDVDFHNQYKEYEDIKKKHWLFGEYISGQRAVGEPYLTAEFQSIKFHEKLVAALEGIEQ